MADDQRLTLVPYLEAADPDFPEHGDYVAGFKNHQGERLGAAVPVARETIERLVLLTTRFRSWIESDGTVKPYPEETSDEVFGEMLRNECLEGAAIDELVAEMVDLGCNEPSPGEDGVLEDYGMLRDRLKRALHLIETEIGRRVTGS